MLWLGWVSAGAGCEGSVAASWWLDWKQRQDISLVQNLGLSTEMMCQGRPSYWLAPIMSVEAITHPSVQLVSMLEFICWVGPGIGGLRSTLGQYRRGCLWMQ